MIKETIKSTKNTFYFGDPCYALDDKLYKAWCKGSIKEGLIKVNGKPIMIVAGTMYGDGCYNGYGVDSGTLALIPIEYCPKMKEALGQVFEGYDEASLQVTDDCTFYVEGKTDGKWISLDSVYTDDEEEEEYLDDGEEPF